MAGMSDIQQQLSILIEVQDVEMQMHRSGRHIEALRSEGLAMDRVVEEREASLAAAKAALAALRKSYREREAETRVNADMIVKRNEKLRAVKTNKEYQSVLKEIEELRKKNSGIEDQMLEQLDRIEAAEAAVQDRERDLAEAVDSCRKKKTAVDAQIQREQAAIEALTAKKAEIGAQADPKLITVLESVKQKVRGQAVVPAQQATCMGCHMNIPAQLFNELQRFDELRFCPHCHRIIYWKEKDGE